MSPFFSTSLDLRNETLRWENYDDQPKSICSEPCPAGHVHNHQDQCCWSCVKCREDSEYVKNDTCISCQPGWAPNERKNGCDKLKVEVIDWLSPWAYVSNVLSFCDSFLGLLLDFIVIRCMVYSWFALFIFLFFRFSFAFWSNLSQYLTCVFLVKGTGSHFLPKIQSKRCDKSDRFNIYLLLMLNALYIMIKLPFGIYLPERNSHLIHFKIYKLPYICLLLVSFVLFLSMVYGIYMNLSTWKMRVCKYSAC